ncbi:hypothetical protein HK413_00960 [Mucilaginibacter sp. S1162]|uniref:Glycosyl transferase n=1 Tax=Mucilaginibacter humi TaxID=2732510 RepID=A0ABX1W0I5_9SPHI|nr:hypothetical protein [Mucilaginibacter humi]NNU33108.1 hypothetical protein [Mucilaginibacter humi]
MSEKNISNDEKLANNKSYFLKNGIRKIGINFSEDSIHYLNFTRKSHIQEIEPYPNSKFKERGIVICAGGVDYFTCAWIAIKRLRFLECTLPMEVWFLNGELSPELIKLFEGLNVECKNFLDYQPTQLTGFQLKPLSIILSRFQEVLFIDADNNCLTDPTFCLTV